MDSNISKICGESNITPNFEEIKSDPNYVFTPDPDFVPLTLFNESGNAVTVNSWVECANYVNGGWVANFTSNANYEKNLFFVLLFISTCLILTKFVKNLGSEYFKK